MLLRRTFRKEDEQAIDRGTGCRERGSPHPRGARSCWSETGGGFSDPLRKGEVIAMDREHTQRLFCNEAGIKTHFGNKPDEKPICLALTRAREAQVDAMAASGNSKSPSSPIAASIK
jgi:hypothetical protein